MKTIFVNEKDQQRQWYIIDAAGKPVGRVAAKAAAVIRGKNKATFTPNQEMGDFVIIINATKAVMTGTKLSEKLYHHHTGFVGGLRTFTYEKLLERHPEDPIRIAIEGMLPGGRLGRRMAKNFRIYAGAEHPHTPQNPKPLEV
jgi:ribosomal protein L13, bacterial type